ncbi:MAG: hypothetical protein GEU81_05475 [Nitriliruptorales bacterium]|nr:hypothetical protein [Nitriliruptorales bacterium]
MHELLDELQPCGDDTSSALDVDVAQLPSSPLVPLAGTAMEWPDPPVRTAAEERAGPEDVDRPKTSVIVFGVAFFLLALAGSITLSF